MNAQLWRRGLVASVVAATVAAGSPAAADETTRLTGEDAAHAALGGGDTAASYGVALPDLAIAHRLPSGAMNLWRMPLSQLEDGFGTPQLVKNLDYGGFSYDRSVTVAGDFADITPADDGTADHIIWHAQPDGGVLLWAVGGGGDTTPRLWQDLRTGGWSYANSRPMVGDVNGDGWDDLVVQHRLGGGFGANIWVFLSDGQRLGAPQLWAADTSWHPGYRYLLADANGDGRDDIIEVETIVGESGYALAYVGKFSDGSSTFSGWHELFEGPASAGWSFAASRQLAGDVTGDGADDLVTIHAQPNGGILVWVHQWNADPSNGTVAKAAPMLWQDLRMGGWSFAGSRQHLADTNGDGADDLISVHSQSGNPGILLWRHLSTGSGLAAPQIVADLRTGGWSYSVSRESVADTYGAF
jgi:hypothetical protein